MSERNLTWASANAIVAPRAVQGLPKPSCEALAQDGRILVVDDNADAAQSLAVLLRLRGHEVQVALGGAEELQMVDENLPELVFLDIGKIDIDAYEVARRLRLRFNSGLMLVALTGRETEHDRQESREAGFDHHLTKPVDLAAVEAVMAALPISKVELQMSNE